MKASVCVLSDVKQTVLRNSYLHNDGLSVADIVKVSLQSGHPDKPLGRISIPVVKETTLFGRENFL